MKIKKMFQTINQCSMQIILWLEFSGVWQKRNYIDTGRNMKTELGRDSFLESLECVIRLQKAYCEYIRTTPLKCYYDQKCIITPSFKSLCPREVRLIEPPFLTSTGHDYKIYI